MRNIVLVLYVLFTCSTFSQVKSLTGIQPFQKPSEGKSLVYILRSGAGAMVNFRIYKDDKYLGPLISDQYMVLECEPGNHLFWAVSENRDFLEATLEADKVYVINVEGRMGAFIAAVAVKPLNPNEKRDKKLFSRKIRNSIINVYDESKIQDDKSENITKGLEKYQELKDKNSSKILKLTSDMFFEDANKPN